MGDEGPTVGLWTAYKSNLQGQPTMDDIDTTEEISLTEANLDERGNWTIKGVPLRFRLAVRKGAQVNGESTFARIARAHELLEAQEAGQTILRPANGSAGRALANIEADKSHLNGQPQANRLPDRLQRIAFLARLAMELTPEGKDSKAAQKARRAVCAEFDTLLPGEPAAAKRDGEGKNADNVHVP